MLSKSGWHMRAALIWTGVVAIGAAITFFIHRLPWNPMLLVALDTFVWVAIGSSLVGTGSYEKYREQKQLVDRYHRRAANGGESA